MDIVLLAGLLILALLLGLACLVIYQLILQNGRMLSRLDTMESWAAGWSGEIETAYAGFDEVDVEEYTGMLPLGVPAPAFALADLNGVTRNLSEWRGQRVLLVFFDPESSFCRRLLPMLAAIEIDVVERPVTVVVSTGDLSANRALFDESAFSGPVLLQRDMEVADAYKVDGTPMSYLIDADGSIASSLAVGIQATLILAGEPNTPDAAHATPGSTVRNGLPPGSNAPVFRLPRIDGGELSLLDYRGRQVVVVFSEVDCEPCERLAKRIAEAHRETPDPPVVIVSRGTVEENRSWVDRSGLSVPVAIQRNREVSRDYAVLATPTAYLIDEWGTIASEVVSGPDAIMALIDFVSENSDNRALTP